MWTLHGGTTCTCDFGDITGTYSLDLWRNCRAALQVHIESYNSMILNCHAALHVPMTCTFEFSSQFCVPIAYMLYAEVCHLQICLFYHQHCFHLQNNTKLHSPLN